MTVDVLCIHCIIYVIQHDSIVCSMSIVVLYIVYICTDSTIIVLCIILYYDSYIYTIYVLAMLYVSMGIMVYQINRFY